MQLAYQIAIHGRQELALAPDEYAGFVMTLLRLLAFRPLILQRRLLPGCTKSGLRLSYGAWGKLSYRQVPEMIATSRVAPSAEAGKHQWTFGRPAKRIESTVGIPG